jgi:hypothetical protein
MVNTIEPKNLIGVGKDGNPTSNQLVQAPHKNVVPTDNTQIRLELASIRPSRSGEIEIVPEFVDDPTPSQSLRRYW